MTDVELEQPCSSEKTAYTAQRKKLCLIKWMGFLLNLERVAKSLGVWEDIVPRCGWGERLPLVALSGQPQADLEKGGPLGWRV